MNAADIVLRSSAILGVGLISHVLLARRSAALRHFVLAAAILLSAAVVPLSLALPSWDVRLPTLSRSDTQVSSVVTVVEPVPSWMRLRRRVASISRLSSSFAGQSDLH